MGKISLSTYFLLILDEIQIDALNTSTKIMITSWNHLNKIEEITKYVNFYFVTDYVLNGIMDIFNEVRYLKGFVTSTRIFSK